MSPETAFALVASLVVIAVVVAIQRLGEIRDAVRSLADQVGGYVRAHPGIVEFFRHVRIPDEIFFQTLVMNSPFRDRVSPADLRYIDWAEGGDSPRVLTSADLPALLASDALFARKFDPEVDAAVLDALDRRAAAEEG